MLTQDEIKNILALIAQATIKGGEALIVAQLQNKLFTLLETPAKVETPKEEPKTE